MAPTKMRAVQVKDGKGPPSALYVGEADVPSLGQDEVLVKVKAFGINRADCLQRLGQYPLPPGASTIIGLEFAGTVAQSTSTSTTWNVGDECFGLTTGGAYAEYAKVPSQMLLPKPPGLSWEEAAGVPENFLTAWQALSWIAKLKPGEDVLIHAGGSGVGLAAIQLARGIGAKNVFVTAGSEDKVAFCQKMGATAGINYKATNWPEELGKLSEGGVDVIIDFIGASYWEGNIQSLRRDGRLVLLGMMGGLETKANLGQLLFKRLQVTGTTLRTRSIEYQDALVQSFGKDANGVKRLVKGHAEKDEEIKYRDGALRVVIHKTFPFEEIVQAHEEMEANKSELLIASVWHSDRRIMVYISGLRPLTLCRYSHCYD